MSKIVYIFFLVLYIYVDRTYAGTFVVDYAYNRFLKDGQPFRYVSGEMMYSRIHPDLWADRLQRVRALGFNAIQVYVPWNLHEPFPGTFDFSGGLNLTQFFLLAQQNELNVLLRAGPYICAEWENGGFPWWLITYSGIQYRRYEPNYIAAIKNYFTNGLLPLIKPLMYQNGGPILMVQIENELGDYGVCDRNYTEFLRDTVRSVLGNDTVLYTTDNPFKWALDCGYIPETLATVDFSVGPDKDIDSAFAIQRQYNNGGPSVCSEFYPGWIVYWDEKNPGFPSADAFMSTFEYMFSLNASFSAYMVHGGTNFEFQNGAGHTISVITSYDYNAPISENGATTALYKRLHDFLQNQTGWVNPPLAIPPNPPATNYGQVTLQRIGANLVSTLTQIQETCHNSTDPLDFEQINHGYGFVMYTNVLATGGAKLTAPNIRDFGYVFLNNAFQGIISRDFNFSSNVGLSLNLPTKANPGDVLRILVENRGRQNVGYNAWWYDETSKGLHSNVTLDGGLLQNWFACGINLTKPSIDSLTTSFFEQSKNQEVLPEKATSQPGVYVGQFDANTLTDTFFNSTGWGKGQLFVNGYNMGRYWNVGYQTTLYVPKPVIQPKNTVLLIELIGAQQNTANLIDHAIFNYG